MPLLFSWIPKVKIHLAGVTQGYEWNWYHINHKNTLKDQYLSYYLQKKQESCISHILTPAYYDFDVILLNDESSGFQEGYHTLSSIILSLKRKICWLLAECYVMWKDSYCMRHAGCSSLLCMQKACTVVSIYSHVHQPQRASHLYGQLKAEMFLWLKHD